MAGVSQTPLNLDLEIEEHGRLKKSIGISAAVFFILGNVIGIGIFLTPKGVAVQAENPYLFLGLWLFGGLIALAGAMSSAELGIMMPHAGGDYIFLRKTYGMASAFLYGYLSLAFSYTGSIAAMATGVIQYQGQTIAAGLGMDGALTQVLLTIPFPSIEHTLEVRHILAILIVLALTLLNWFGVSRSIVLQKLVTIGPAVILIGLGLIIFFQTLFGETEGAILAANLNYRSPADLPSFGRLAAAMIPIFFTYAGWNVTLYLAEDIKNPEKVIPISMIVSLGLITLVYTLFCFVLLARIPFADLISPNIGDPASIAWGSVIGSWAAWVMGFFNNGVTPPADVMQLITSMVISIVIALLILGGLNTSILSGSRVYLAMARDGIFFSQARRLHDRFHTPTWSLWVQGVWACALILIFRDFDTILAIATIIMVFLSIMTISCVFILRFRMGEAHEIRQKKDRMIYRALGYPYFPALYIISTLFILIGTISNDLSEAEDFWSSTTFVAVVVTVIGYVTFLLWKRLRRNGKAKENAQ